MCRYKGIRKNENRSKEAEMKCKTKWRPTKDLPKHEIKTFSMKIFWSKFYGFIPFHAYHINQHEMILEESTMIEENHDSSFDNHDIIMIIYMS